MSAPVPLARPAGCILAVVNPEDGLEARVIRRDPPLTGYAVVLVDTDAGEAISCALYYPILRDAVSKAIALSGVLFP